MSNETKVERERERKRNTQQKAGDKWWVDGCANVNIEKVIIKIIILKIQTFFFLLLKYDN